MDQIDRREAIRRLSALVGGTLSASTVSAVLAGCVSDSERNAYAFQTLAPDQQRLTASIVEAIIPTTDTPGAAEAGVDVFIDKLLTDWMSPAEKGHFMEGLVSFGSGFQEAYGINFTEATTEQKLGFMSPMDLEAHAARMAGQSSIPFFGRIKELTIVGYYTSEIGASQELRYQIIFDKYDGNVDWHEGDRAFS
jgi:hypothetical protein